MIELSRMIIQGHHRLSKKLGEKDVLSLYLYLKCYTTCILTNFSFVILYFKHETTPLWFSTYNYLLQYFQGNSSNHQEISDAGSNRVKVL